MVLSRKNISRARIGVLCGVHFSLMLRSLWVRKPLIGGFKVAFLAKLNPYEFVLGSQCVPLSGSWEGTAEFCSRSGYTYVFSFSFSSLL